MAQALPTGVSRTYRGSEMLAVGNTSIGPEHKAGLVQEGDYGLQGSRAPGPQGGSEQPELVLCCHPVAIRVNCSSHPAVCKCGLGGSEQCLHHRLRLSPTSLPASTF